MRHRCCYLWSLAVFALLLTAYYTQKWEGDEEEARVAEVKIIPLSYDYYNVENERNLFDVKDFKYLLNSDACDFENVSHVHIVTSFSGDVEARSAIRRAFPQSELEKLGVARVFLLALFPESHNSKGRAQRALVDEAERFSDLVQGNFIESYRNLTYKHVMGLKWVAEFCTNVSFVIKTDDDILVDMYRLIDTVENEKGSFQMMGYLLTGMRPIRMKANKWYVTKNEYPAEKYPPFLSGWMYVATLAAAKKLLTHLPELDYFWIDDLFVTGLLSERAGVHLTNATRLFTLHPQVVECCIRKGLKCDFLAAPDGGDHSLQLKFQNHSKLCYVMACPTPGPGLTIEDRCVAKRKLNPLKKGLPQITIIQ